MTRNLRRLRAQAAHAVTYAAVTGAPLHIVHLICYTSNG